MSARGTTWGKKLAWVELIANVLQKYPGATNADIDYHLRSRDYRPNWPPGADDLPPSLKNYISDARKGLTDLDLPWSIGVTVDNLKQWPTDAIPDLMAVRRRGLAGGVTLTVRQARWLVVLRPLISKMTWGEEFRLQYLYGFAVTYSAREQVSKDALDTADLDTFQAFEISAPGELNRLLGLSAAYILISELGDVTPLATDVKPQRKWLDDETSERLWYLADSYATYESNHKKAGRLSGWPLWRIEVVLIGLRAAIKLPNWPDDERGQRQTAKAIKYAVEENDWNKYAELTGLPYRPIRYRRNRDEKTRPS